MNEELFDFEKLIVYQRALEYVDFAYKVTKSFPKEERFSLTDQFRRAATSICLNIAEGSGGSKIELKLSAASCRESSIRKGKDSAWSLLRLKNLGNVVAPVAQRC